MIKVKRVHQAPETQDGFRILVDRLWPRGLSKDKAHVDAWMKEIAPSEGLRKWFGHDPDRWPGFESRYREELLDKKDRMAELRKLEKQHGVITLLFGAKDEKRNNAVVLAKRLRK